jgi:RNA polymerase sigma factor (sigma-70 family)
MSDDDSDETLITVFCTSGSDAVANAAFKVVHRRNHRPLLSHLMQRLRGLQKYRNPPSASDIAQLAWERVINALKRGGYEVRKDARFKTFLFRVADNCLNDEFDRWKREQGRTVGDHVDDAAMEHRAHAVSPDDPVVQLARKRLIEDYRRFLDTLPPRQREAVGRHHLGYSRDETAGAMKVGSEGVKTLRRVADPRVQEWAKRKADEMREVDE